MQLNESTEPILIRKYKIRQSGKRGLALSIPTTWAEKHGIEAGTVVNISQDFRGRLILTAENKEAANV